MTAVVAAQRVLGAAAAGQPARMRRSISSAAPCRSVGQRRATVRGSGAGASTGSGCGGRVAAATDGSSSSSSGSQTAADAQPTPPSAPEPRLWTALRSLQAVLRSRLAKLAAVCVCLGAASRHPADVALLLAAVASAKLVWEYVQHELANSTEEELDARCRKQQLAEVLAEQRDLVESEQIECRSVAWFLVFAAVVVYSVAFASACVVGLGQPLPYPPSTFAAGFTLFLLLPPFNKLCVHGFNAWYAYRLAAAAERRLASAEQSGAAGSRGQQPSTS